MFRRLFQYSPAWLLTTIIGLFAWSGLASAASISNTGPNSFNKISTSVNNLCRQTNNNNLRIHNYNHQTSTTGSATVGGNQDNEKNWPDWDPAVWQANGQSFSSWWDGLHQWIGKNETSPSWNSSNNDWTPPEDASWQNTWSNWDPASWQANGQSFSQWHSQLTKHLTSNEDDWRNNWSGGNTNAGSAKTGNASNVNSSSFSVNISNGNFCTRQVQQVSGGGRGSEPGSPSQPQVLGQSVASSTGSGGFGGSFFGGGSNFVTNQAPTTSSQPAPSFVASPAPITSTSPTNSPNNPCPCPITGDSISNTGPGSTNIISSSFTNRSTVTNNNNLSANNSNNQSANSGVAIVASNTSAGDGGSGSASNSNGIDAGLDVAN